MTEDWGESGDRILQGVTASALRVFSARACSIALLEGDELVYVHASGEGAEGIVGTRLPTSRGLAGFAITGGDPVAIFEVEHDQRFARDVAESTGCMPRALIAAPLETERGSYGVLTVLDPALSGPVGERLLELVTLLAHQAALTVEAARDGRPPVVGDPRADLRQLVEAIPDGLVTEAAERLRSLLPPPPA